jgi:hypothetical protein
MGEQMLKKRAGSIEVTPSIGVVLLLPSVHESMHLERKFRRIPWIGLDWIG